MLLFLVGEAMPMDPDKDMRALPAEAKLGGPELPAAPPCYSDVGWLRLARRRGLNVRIWVNES